MRTATGRLRRGWLARLGDAFEAGGLLLWILVCVVSLVFLLLTGISAYRKNLELDRRIGELQEEIARMEAADAALRRQKEALARDPVYVERMLRKDLRMVRDGEQVVRQDD